MLPIRMNINIFNVMATPLTVLGNSTEGFDFSSFLVNYYGWSKSCVSNVYVTVTPTRDTHRKKHG